MFSQLITIKKCIVISKENLHLHALSNFYLVFLYLVLVETVAEESEDAVTEQYSILFISAGVCVAVFIIFLGVLCFR